VNDGDNQPFGLMWQQHGTAKISEGWRTWPMKTPPRKSRPKLFKNNGLELRLTHTYPAKESPWKVPAYQFDIIHNGERVGTISLRVSRDPTFTDLAGQIGFALEEQYRGRGLAGKAVELLLPLAQYHDLSPLWFTTTTDNRASQRVLEKLGAEFVKVVPIPPAYPSYAAGEREKLLYRLKFPQT
jgi:RimJ/RimL family protein N-acetyltransferase